MGRDKTLAAAGLVVSVANVVIWMARLVEVNTLLHHTVWQVRLFAAVFCSLWWMPYVWGSDDLRDAFAKNLNLRMGLFRKRQT